MRSDSIASIEHDPEQNWKHDSQLDNHSVHSFTWKNVSVTVKDRKTKDLKKILSKVDGCVKAGELLAIMGPSGSGKTTLLNVLAHREASSGASVDGEIYVDGVQPSLRAFRHVTSYVEQEDALIGSLTIRETLNFAARLSLPSGVGSKERMRRIDSLLESFGLRGQANMLIGTPIRKGISGGQKRRVSVASQLITGPKILFLDEPTSGLDSAASNEVMSFVKDVASKYGLIVIASIHQPSTSTFKLFDKLLLLSAGRPCYFGLVYLVPGYFSSLGSPLPTMTNPAEHLLEQTNVDFARDREPALQRLQEMQRSWAQSPEAEALLAEINGCKSNMAEGCGGLDSENFFRSNEFITPVTLLHRSFIKSYRDVVAYGIRIVMYTGERVLKDALLSG
ncbi:MAG: hypothetical protein M1840_009170 [Geoglossum simile]|nr:MAG: hypothetical protein M1840_009170 [Geoglossum simile]